MKEETYDNISRILYLIQGKRFEILFVGYVVLVFAYLFLFILYVL